MDENYYASNAFENHEVINPHPVFNDSVNIIFSSDANYIPYLSVTLQSLIDNSSQDNNYDIIILSSGIFDYQKRFIVSQFNQRPNFSIRFLNMEQYIRQYGLDKFFTRPDMSMAAYYRLFAGKIFDNYQKILYLDCDIVINSDIAELAKIDIKDYPIAACLDTGLANRIDADDVPPTMKYYKEFAEYMRETLHFTDLNGYFNSGVMVINIPKFNETGLDRLLDLAKKNNKFFHDQNVLNVAFQHNYYQLPTTWNCQYHIKFHFKKYKKYLSVNDLSLYEEYDSQPNIVHYTSKSKPWKELNHSMSNFWWKYAIKTPFYPVILKNYSKQQLLQQSFIINHIGYLRFQKVRFWLCKNLSRGRKRERYQAKYKAVKQLIRTARIFREKFWQNLLNDNFPDDMQSLI